MAQGTVGKKKRGGERAKGRLGEEARGRQGIAVNLRFFLKE